MNNFDKWNTIKKEINQKNTIWTIKPREIYWVKIGKNIGYEQDGKGENFLRPVLILKKFNKNVFIGIPLTSQEKSHYLYFKFNYKNNKNSYAILSQIRLYDVKRIYSKSGKINYEDFQQLKEQIKNILDL